MIRLMVKSEPCTVFSAICRVMRQPVSEVESTEIILTSISGGGSRKAGEVVNGNGLEEAIFSALLQDCRRQFYWWWYGQRRFVPDVPSHRYYI